MTTDMSRLSKYINLLAGEERTPALFGMGLHLYLYINDRETRSANQETQETLGTVHRTKNKQTKITAQKT
jgi:hypothetical protein